MAGGVTRLVLVRHGEAQTHVDQVIGGHRGCTGLSELGRRQAAALRDRLASTGELASATALWSSILPRAVETADIIAPAIGGAGAPGGAGPAAGAGAPGGAGPAAGTDARVAGRGRERAGGDARVAGRGRERAGGDARVAGRGRERAGGDARVAGRGRERAGELRREQSCDLCELHVGDEIDGLRWEELRERYGPAVDNGYEPWAPGTESLAEFVARVGRILVRLAREHLGETVVIACHGGVIDASFSVLGGLAVSRRAQLRTHYTENTSLTEWVDDGSGWALARYNDTAHLSLL